MVLTEKHFEYENNCRRMFIGETIQGIIYGEVKYTFEDEESLKEEPSYFTKYSEIDTLDHSIYFKTKNKTIYVFWNNTFFSYGLLSKEIDLKETPNDYEQKWDVSNEEKWINLIGQRIIDFKINWEEVSSFIYPQTFLLETESGKTIILSASEFKDSEQNKVYGMSDNLLVTTNLTLAKELKII